jgi:hypothetical protein
VKSTWSVKFVLFNRETKKNQRYESDTWAFFFLLFSGNKTINNETIVSFNLIHVPLKLCK